MLSEQHSGGESINWKLPHFMGNRVLPGVIDIDWISRLVKIL
jgi:hypothetical protein